MDAQGYHLDNIFYPKEFSFVCNYFSVCYEVLFSYSSIPNLNKKHFKNISYQRQTLHGLPVYSVLRSKERNENVRGIILVEQLPKLVQFLYKKVKRDNDSMIAVKNPQLVSFLKNIPVPIFDLTKEKIDCVSCPTFDQFNEFESHFCDIHSRIHQGSKYRCALKKCISIWNWLKVRMMSADIYAHFKCSPEYAEPYPEINDSSIDRI